MGTFLNLRRRDATQTTLIATLSGVDGTAVPAGSQASTSDGLIFTTDIGSVIGVSGTAQVAMTSGNYGPREVSAGALRNVITPISGWTGVSNAAAGVVGRDRETDSEYRNRMRLMVGRNALGSLAAIRAAALEVSDVTRVQAYENATSAAAQPSDANIDWMTIDPNSVLVVTDGGVQADIESAIRMVLAPGITLLYEAARERVIEVSVDVTARPGFRGVEDVLAIINRMVSYVGDLGIGIGLLATELYGPAYTIENHYVTSITVTRSAGQGSGTTETSNLQARDLLTLSSSNVTITVS